MKHRSGGKVSGFIGKVANWRPFMDQPIGKALVYSTALGVAQGVSKLTDIAASKIGGSMPVNQIKAISFALTSILFKLRFMSGLLGQGLTDAIAAFAWMGAVNQLTNITGTVDEFISNNLAAPIARTLLPAPPPPAPAPEATASAAVSTKPAFSIWSPSTWWGVNGLGDIRTVAPYEQSFGSVGSLTAVEAKLAAIRG